MINIRSLDDRTFEELMSEALAQIPLYTSEWTNFNASDPGITVLENLTAFEILQQNRIDQITPAIRYKLLKLVGFREEKGRCARVLLSPENLKQAVEIYGNQKFYLGDLCFETNKALQLMPRKIKKIFSICGKNREKKEFSFLADREVSIPTYVFGQSPACGDAVYFLTDGLGEAEEELIFYFTVADRYNRNPFEQKGKVRFAQLKWECYCDGGFREMKVKDGTGCFLVSGEVRMRIPAPVSVYSANGEEGYVIRATLTKAEYDIRPKLISVDGFLFEAWQKETMSACYTYQKMSSVTVRSDLVDSGYFTVFCKEEKGASYRRYEPATISDGEGRYYDVVQTEPGKLQISFNRKKYRFGPEKLKAPIKVLLYSEQVMRQYSLGEVLGYDRQSITLPLQNIVPETFCILAVRTNEEGEEICDFVRPGYQDKDALVYHLYEKEGRIEIESAGLFIGARLYMGTCSVTAGPEGNIRKGSRLRTKEPADVTFYNPEAGTEGRFRESLKELEERFLKDLKKPYTAVTASDYEKLVMQTPELCIHKVKAYMSESGNVVRIAVKPGTDERFPRLSDIYRKTIKDYLEDKRLLTTKIEIMSPQYVPIDVHGTIYVKSQYEHGRRDIEEAIHRTLDYLDSEKNFGDRIKFDDLFHEIQMLDCVEFIYDLRMNPEKPGLARVEELDILPAEDCLCYVGRLYLEIGTHRK